MKMPGQIITWYSFKGGVGRSMALANVATLLAHRGKRVLAVDFDLEAPGLHRYFLQGDPGAGRLRYEPRTVQAGVIELVIALRDELEKAFPGAGDYRPEDEKTQDICKRIVETLVDSPQYLYRVNLKHPGAPEAEVTLSFMTAGRFEAQYAERVREVDWRGLYEEFAEVFELLRRMWRERYDYVLIDSRTGLTDAGSICTVVLPDKLVVVFSPNEQSLQGALEVARQSVELRNGSPEAKMPIFPLLSRVEPGEEELRNAWIRRAAESFSRLFAELYGERHDLLRYFESVQVSHSSYYAYGERIAVEEQRTGGFATPAEGYGRFVDCLLEPSVLAWQARVAHPVPGHRALVVSFEHPFKPPLELDEVITIPETLPPGISTALRKVPLDVEAWSMVIEEIDRGIERVKQGVRSSLHLFTMAPYPAAVLLGRRLDALARACPLYTYQWEPVSGEWRPFSVPGAPADAPEPEPFFREPEHLDAAVRRIRDGVVIAIEGTRQIHDDNLFRLAGEVGAGRIVRLRQRNAAPLRSVGQARNARLALRSVLESVQHERPTATLHIVTTAAVAMLVELGRLLSPTVYREAIVYQYDPRDAAYVPALDVIPPRVMTPGSTPATAG